MGIFDDRVFGIGIFVLLWGLLGFEYDLIK